MSDITDLPLFGGSAAEDPSAAPRRQFKKRAADRQPRPRVTGARVITIPLARNRQVVAQLVSMFQATPPGPARSAAFRRDVLTPLTAQRLILGLNSTDLDREMLALEEAMVRVILGDERDAGSAA